MTSAEIVDALAATRPVAPPALRAQVAAIAASTPPPRPSLAGRLLPRRRLFLVALPAAAVLAVASAGAIGLVDSRDEAVTMAGRDASTQLEQATTQKAGAAEAAPAAGAGTALSDAAPPGPTTGRAQKVTATLTVQVKDTDALSEATQQALQTTRSLGGYVVSVSYATAEDGAASLTLRVPTTAVQDAITRLSALGTIVAQQVQIQDLQESIDALERRIANLRERIARLTARIDDPAVDEETRATLVARRSAARAELAAARGDRAGQVAEAKLATIQLTLATDPESSALPPTPSRFDNALDRAVEILALEAMAVLFVLILAGPFVLVALAVWLTRRALGRRANERLLT
jgi:hypothetical protein